MMSSCRHAALTGVLAALACALFLTTSAHAQGWEHVTTENGFEISVKARPDTDLMPLVRGRGTLDANIYFVLAVLNDVDRHPEWIYGCVQARLLERKDPQRLLVYNLTDIPWPLDDRDVVLDSRVTVDDASRTILVGFKASRSALQKPIDDVVRITRMAGHYRLTAVSPTKTKIEYMLDIDPGGWIPEWAIEMANKDMALKTLTNLKRQLKKKKGTYDAFLKSWDPSLNAESPGFVVGEKKGAAGAEAP